MTVIQEMNTTEFWDDIKGLMTEHELKHAETLSFPEKGLWIFGQLRERGFDVPLDELIEELTYQAVH